MLVWVYPAQGDKRSQRNETKTVENITSRVSAEKKSVMAVVNMS